MLIRILWLAVIAMGLLALPALAMIPNADELAAARKWTDANLRPARGADLPFSFNYGGKPFSTLVRSWKTRETTRKLDKQRTERTITYTDPKTGLVLRCVIVSYRSFPTVEWTLYLKNTGSSDTAIISDILPLDAWIERGRDRELILYHMRGTPCMAADYEPFATVPGPGASKRISAAGGRPSNSDLPYFNIEWEGQGIVLAVGWPGQWSAEFSRDGSNGLSLKAGQELTHFKLHPGEEVRTPLIVMQFYRGDWIRGQNIWRRWMVAHNVPRPGGKLTNVQLAACSSHQYGEMIRADTESQKMFVDRYLERGIKLDYWWMDAGWYPYDPDYSEWGWPNTGTWEVDQTRFPGGFKPITDYAHGKGVKIIVWFEPERVTSGTWLYNHPEWLLTNPKDPNGQKLLDLGNKDARNWLTDHVDGLLTRQGIDLYRQDFNMDPLDFWRANDSEDRQGITEIRYVEGYLTYWDELRRRHPNMLIDSCASGGRRNDLETLRRAVPLLRSDFLLEPISQQSHTYGVAMWYPFYGTGFNQFEAYSFRSMMCPHMTACYDMRRDDQDYTEVRKLLKQWREVVAPNYFGDYYPLTDYSLEKNVWMAWQFDRPEVGRGVVQAFRRDDAPAESTRFKLRGLEPGADYLLTNIDSGNSERMAGKALMEQGLTVTVHDKPSSAIVSYSI
ncbi:MAG: alpha-galactosidase [Armatimonadetes bacterium]|nr:alpha-galactosidase [Armatimonadota bacterium]